MTLREECIKATEGTNFSYEFLYAFAKRQRADECRLLAKSVEFVADGIRDVDPYNKPLAAVIRAQIVPLCEAKAKEYET